MGFWEYFQLATDELKRRSPGLDNLKDAYRTSCSSVGTATSMIGAAAAVGGEKAHNLLRSAADAARLGSPGLMPVEGACHKAWNYTWWAAGEVDRAVRVEGPRRVAELMPDADKRRQIGRVLKDAGVSFADVAITESARSVPWGLPVYRITKRTATELPKIWREEAKDKEDSSLKPPEADNLDRGAAATKRTVEELQAELRYLRARNAVLTELVTKGGAPPHRLHGPERVIELYLRDGFRGRGFLDALIIPVPSGQHWVGGDSPGEPKVHEHTCGDL